MRKTAQRGTRMFQVHPAHKPDGVHLHNSVREPSIPYNTLSTKSITGYQKTQQSRQEALP